MFKERRKKIVFIALLMALILLGVVTYYVMDREARRNRIKSIVADLKQETEGRLLKVDGKIPEWLAGTFVRNGPVEVQIGHQKLGHWFDGLAMLHAFSIQNGQVSYTNKFLRTDAYKMVFEEGSLNFVGFDRPAGSFMWERIHQFFENMLLRIQRKEQNRFPIENANVNISKFDDRYVALTEIPLPVVFDLKNLNTLGVFDYPDNLPKSGTFESAHPQFNQRLNEQFNYLVNYDRNSKYIIYRLNSNTGAREVISEIPVDKPAYMHSFAITENYIILVEFPFVVNPLDLMFMTKPFIQNFHWEPARGSHFLVIDKKTGEVVNAIKDYYPFFAFHHANAFETQDKDGKPVIVLDIITYSDAKIIFEVTGSVFEDNIKNHRDRNYYQTKLMRYRIPMAEQGKIESSLILDASLEYPRVNGYFNANPYRYLYAVDVRPLTEKEDVRPIYKIDMESGKTIFWQQAGMVPGEAVFVGRGGGSPSSALRAPEDEGVLMSIMLDVFHNRAFLLILDAKTLQEIARAYAPYPIPIGLHGQFINQSLNHERI